MLSWFASDPVAGYLAGFLKLKTLIVVPRVRQQHGRVAPEDDRLFKCGKYNDGDIPAILRAREQTYFQNICLTMRRIATILPTRYHVVWNEPGYTYAMLSHIISGSSGGSISQEAAISRLLDGIWAFITKSSDEESDDLFEPR